MNPAPDADVNSVGQENFDWIVYNVAELAVRKAKQHSGLSPEYRWSAFLSGYNDEAASSAKSTGKKTAAPRKVATRAAKG
jgi:hypothetical protein